MRWRIRKQDKVVTEIRIPYNPNPSYKTYVSPSAALSVLGAQCDVTPALGSFYINIALAPKSEQRPFFMRISPWLELDQFAGMGYFNFDSIDIDRNSFQPLGTLEYLLEKISNGFCVLVNANKFYIPESNRFLRVDDLHPCVIAGFNDEKKLFDVYMYNRSGEYGLVHVHYLFMLMALRYSKTNRARRVSTIKGYKYSLSEEVNMFSPYDAIFQINSYLSSSCGNIEDEPWIRSKIPEESWRMMIEKEGVVYGIEAVRLHVRILRDEISRKEQIDMRRTRVVWERKKIMLGNLKYWGKITGNEHTFSSLHLRYKGIVDWAHKSHMSVFEYNKNSNTENVSDLLNKVDDTLRMEKEILSIARNSLISSFPETSSSQVSKVVDPKYLVS
ncbi:hypothetical protein MLD52_11495 [Puniceicoccaceae bacterium K14]|nr:hypothetical protein [Puniceicoccaceae bacterium K14]